MSHPLGASRCVVERDHAVIPPDTHVPTAHPCWHGGQATVHLSPQIGAELVFYTVQLDAGGRGEPAARVAPDVERFLYVLEGAVEIASERLAAGGWALLPPGCEHAVSASAASRLLVLEKRYRALEGVPVPGFLVGNESAAPAVPFQGDPDALLQTLLPEEPGFDLAVNVFTYSPGGTLPQVEIHVMEHAMLMLQGAGVYRLGERWYPVQAGDVLWIGPYCPQWFVAMGKEPVRYLYSKDMNRAPAFGTGV